jgi:hypothetical protein
LLLRAGSAITCRTKAGANDDLYNSILQGQFDRENLAGLQASVIEEGKPAWSSAYGLANVLRRIPMTPEATVTPQSPVAGSQATMEKVLTSAA